MDEATAAVLAMLAKEEEQARIERQQQLEQDEQLARRLVADTVAAASAPALGASPPPGGAALSTASLPNAADSADSADDAALAARMEREDEELYRLQQQEAAAASEALATQLNSMFQDEQLAQDLVRSMEREQADQQQQLSADAKFAAELQQQLHASEAERERKEVQQLEDAHLADRPSYWGEPLAPGERYRRVKIAPDSNVFKLVMQRFKACQRTVIAIEYVQNEVVWERYNQAKRELITKEAVRFHGTPATNVDGICREGLLVSHDRIASGTTIWTAMDPNTSVRFSLKGRAHDGSLYMFFCRTLTPTPENHVTTLTRNDHVFPELLIQYR
jgi:hypothetical protein